MTLLDRLSGRYFVFYVHTSSFGAVKRAPFDPTKNPGTCVAITPEIIDMVNRVSRGEEIEAPRGRMVITYPIQE